MIKADSGWWARYRYDRSPREVEPHLYPVVGWSDDGNPLVAHPDTGRLTVADAIEMGDLKPGQAWEFLGVEYVEPRNSHGVLAAPPGWMHEGPDGHRERVVGFLVHDPGSEWNDGEGLYMTAQASPIVVGDDGQAREAAFRTGCRLVPPNEHCGD